MTYIKSNAAAKEVTTKGKTIEQYPPPIAYTPKKAATERKNMIQYLPVDFLVVSIISCYLLQI